MIEDEIYVNNSGLPDGPQLPFNREDDGLLAQNVDKELGIAAPLKDAALRAK